MNKMEKERIKDVVKERYGKVASRGGGCCTLLNSCCKTQDMSAKISQGIGYSNKDIESAPGGSNLGLGCGNPVALASLKRGETVLDLGSGAGFDCFLSAKAVGPEGHIIGVDMTPEMVEKARSNAKEGDVENVEFRLGEIEDLPIPDSSVDVVISNCVINLVPDKERAFREAFRVLNPGGRLMVSDIVLRAELPAFLKNSVDAYVGCVSGAESIGDYLQTVQDSGFKDVKVVNEKSFPIDFITNDPTSKELIEANNISPEEVERILSAVVSITVFAVKTK